MSQRVGIFIQARSTSTRLPRKAYAPLPQPKGKALLEHVYLRLSQVNQDYITVILAPNGDQELIEWCQTKKIPVFCGAVYDVRERYRQAAVNFGVDIVVRATGDNPCVDSKIAQEAVNGLLDTQTDLFSYGNLPLGIAVEAMTTEALLRRIGTEQGTAEHREHVSVHIKQRKDIFRCLHPKHKLMGSSPHSPIRLTVDTSEDLEVVRSVFNCLGDDFGLDDILRLYRRRPNLFKGNKDIKQVKVSAAAS